MTLQEIDLLLADWKQKIDLVSQNIIDLHGLPTYQRLSGVSGFPKANLTGVTQARVSSALEAMTELFQHFDLLITTINKAAELRKQVPRFLGAETKIQEIEQILTGTSIKLAVVQIPLAQRSLLSAAETATSISPVQLLAAMTSAFQVAKDVVVAVDAAWTNLELMLVDTETEISALEKLAISQGRENFRELSLAREKISAVRDRIASDPLAVSDSFAAEINPLIARVKTNLEQLINQQKELQTSFFHAHQLLNQLTEIHQQTETAFNESREKVVDHSTLQTPLEQAQIEALRQWLIRLEAKYKEGLLNPVRIGLENCIAKMKEYIATEQEADTANKAPLELRAELRGRLEALKAKALARGLAEDATLSQLANSAKRLLYIRPTALDQAAELVSQYDQELNRKIYLQSGG